MRADEAAIGLQRAEIERDVGQARGQDTARRAAWEVALEGMAVGHPTAELVDQLAHGDASRGELDAGRLDAAGDREAAHALAVMAALAGDEGGAVSAGVAHPETGLEVIDQSGRADKPNPA